jgi:hypothetical protein
MIQRTRQTTMASHAEGGGFLSRVVVIVGREPGDIGAALGPRLAGRTEVLLLSLGYPPSEEQQESFREALELAVEAGATFDSRLVLSTRSAIGYLEPGDDVVVAAEGRDGRRITWTLRRRGPSSARAGR